MVGPNMRPIAKEKRRDDRSRRSRRSRSRSRDRHRDRDDRRRRSRSRDRDSKRKRDGDDKDENDKKKFKPVTDGKEILDELYLEVDPLKKKSAVVPLAVEDVLKKKKEQEEETSKPVFMTKEMREQAAIAKRAEEVAAKRAKLREEEAARREFDAARRNRPSRPEKAKVEEVEQDRDQQKILEAIKEQYLVKKKEKKKIQKPSDKFRFSFDWEMTDDTSTDLNPLYQHRADVALAFGRGKFAGTDRNLQNEKATIYDSIMEERRAKALENVSDEKKQKAAKRAIKNKYKDRHWSEKPLSEMTSRDWRIFKEDYNISTRGGGLPLPLRNWEEGELHPAIMKAIEEANYKEPSPIQRQAIPIGLQFRDLIGIAETGSGKTCAFVIPMLTFISKLPPMTKENASEGPYAIVLAPTRELAQQIEVETKRFSKHLNYRVMSIVGGGGMKALQDQGFTAANGVEVIIATPGRLNDMLERRHVVLNQCTYVVMDEADRMIDLGFEPQVISILDRLPVSHELEEDIGAGNTRQVSDLTKLRITHMFSATMPPAVERMARKYLRKPAQVAIGRAGQVADKVEQKIVWVKSEADKKRLLLETLKENEKDGLFIVFTNTKSTCNVVAKNLEKLGIRAVALHGGKTQDQREESLDLFKQRIKTVLVATNVAGRGIDVPNVTHVINYDMPNELESYTHRIGRTGRAGKKGTAISFIGNDDTEIMYDLKQMCVDANVPIPNELARHESAKQKPGAIAQKPKKRNEVLFLDI